MDKLLLVGLGGFVGSVGRYSLQLLLSRWSATMNFPGGVLAANLLGCFVIGLVCGDAESRFSLSERGRAFLVVGVLGGFTTFSAFGLDCFLFLKEQQSLRALANVVLHLILGIAAVAGGYWAGR